MALYARCPKCGADSAGADTCPACGLIYAKYPNPRSEERRCALLRPRR